MCMLAVIAPKGYAKEVLFYGHIVLSNRPLAAFSNFSPFCYSVVLREDVIKITIIIIKCDRGQDNTRDNITKQHNTNTKAQQQLLELLHHRPKVFKTPAFLSPCSKSFFCGDRLRPGWDRLIHQRRGKRYANGNG